MKSDGIIGIHDAIRHAFLDFYCITETESIKSLKGDKQINMGHMNMPRSIFNLCAPGEGYMRGTYQIPGFGWSTQGPFHSLA